MFSLKRPSAKQEAMRSKYSGIFKWISRITKNALALKNDKYKSTDFSIEKSDARKLDFSERSA